MLTIALINSHDISCGLRFAEVTNENTAEIYVWRNLLTKEEKNSLENPAVDKEQTRKTLTRLAQLTAEELQKRDLLKEPRERFEADRLEKNLKKFNLTTKRSNKKSKNNKSKKNKELYLKYVLPELRVNPEKN